MGNPKSGDFDWPQWGLAAAGVWWRHAVRLDGQQLDGQQLSSSPVWAQHRHAPLPPLAQRFWWAQGGPLLFPGLQAAQVKQGTTWQPLQACQGPAFIPAQAVWYRNAPQEPFSPRDGMIAAVHPPRGLGAFKSGYQILSSMTKDQVCCRA